MAYPAKRRKRFQEDFELVDEYGNVAKTLHVYLDADDVVVRINRKYVALTKALAETTDLKRKAENNEEIGACFDCLGVVVVDLYEAVFGAEDTKTIVDFYDGRYIEMCQEVTPFISQVVIPRCMQIRAENKKTILQKYNRKQHGSILKGLR